MEGARSLQAGTKKVRQFKAVRDGAGRLQAGQRKFDNSTDWDGVRLLYSSSVGGSSAAQGLDGRKSAICRDVKFEPSARPKIGPGKAVA